MGILSGILGAQATEDAAETQANAANQATATELQMFREGQEATAPWREKGEEALNVLMDKIKAGPGKFEESPEYQFRLSEGTKAIDRSAAAKGNLFSGRTAMELQRLGQGEASKEYTNWLANYYSSLNPWQSVAGVGQTTAVEGSRQGNAVAGQIGQNMINSGDAIAGGQINRANAITGAMNSSVNNYLAWKNMGQNTSPVSNISAAYPTNNYVANSSAGYTWEPTSFEYGG